ncbi:MAG TPA: phage/plasmid primase, P4 family, partial [Chloroflexota bacterium]|nr:phage/plasmid primase, P4 family [Chloroflexota bacterium]
MRGCTYRPGQRLSESLVKRMTGGERIVARFLRREFFTFMPTFKVFFGCNHLPRIRGTEHAIWRRIRRIAFTETIADDEQDPNLAKKLEAEASGILAWAVRGCEQWQIHGLAAPEAVIEATQSYRDGEDVLGDFLDERCAFAKQAHVEKGQLYKTYRLWCESNNEHILSHKAFSQRMQERGISDRRGSRGTRIWEGIGLLGDPPPPSDGGEVTGVTGVTYSSGSPQCGPSEGVPGNNQSHPSQEGQNAESEGQTVTGVTGPVGHQSPESLSGENQGKESHQSHQSLGRSDLPMTSDANPT